MSEDTLTEKRNTHEVYRDGEVTEVQGNRSWILEDGIDNGTRGRGFDRKDRSNTSRLSNTKRGFVTHYDNIITRIIKELDGEFMVKDIREWDEYTKSWFMKAKYRDVIKSEQSRDRTKVWHVSRDVVEYLTEE